MAVAAFVATWCLVLQVKMVGDVSACVATSRAR